METVHIALGSNLGERENNIQHALAEISDIDRVNLIRSSKLYETPAVGGPVQPDFMNAACEIQTDHAPHHLLQILLGVEKRMGRVRDVKWGPRIIDLDIVLWQERVVSDDTLVIPHPLMSMREFVLAPLAELAPEAMHPVVHKTVRDLLDALRIGKER